MRESVVRARSNACVWRTRARFLMCLQTRRSQAGNYCASPPLSAVFSAGFSGGACLLHGNIVCKTDCCCASVAYVANTCINKQHAIRTHTYFPYLLYMCKPPRTHLNLNVQPCNNAFHATAMWFDRRPPTATLPSFTSADHTHAHDRLCAIAAAPKKPVGGITRCYCYDYYYDFAIRVNLRLTSSRATWLLAIAHHCDHHLGGCLDCC